MLNIRLYQKIVSYKKHNLIKSLYKNVCNRAMTWRNDGLGNNTSIKMFYQRESHIVNGINT